MPRSARTAPWTISISCVVAALALVACEGATTRVDSRFATPERTVDTLLASYGLDALSQDDVRARMAAHERFELRDRAAYAACFADLGTTSDEGLAGWVLGALAAGKDELRTEIFADRATVSPREGVRIVLRRDARDGAWRIVLRGSVPDDVQRGLASLAARAEQRARATGVDVGR